MKTIGKVKINKNEPTVDFREGGFTKQGGGSLSFCNVFYFGTCLSSIAITQYYTLLGDIKVKQMKKGKKYISSSLLGEGGRFEQ